MAEVLEVNDLDSLDAYRATWNALFSKTPNATFFQTFDWLQIFLRHFGERQKLRVLVVVVDGVVQGIVPLAIRTHRHKLGPVRTLGYPLDAWGNVFGPLGDQPRATLDLAMAHLAHTPRDWDRLQLDWVAHDSTDHGRTHRCMQRAGLPPSLELSDTTSLVDLSAGWQAYLDARSVKTRHQLRRHLRQVDHDGDVRYLRHRPQSLASGDGDPRWDLYDWCQQVAERSWQSDSSDGNTLCHPRYREFYRDTHAAAARLGMLDLNVLTHHDRPVAFNYNYVVAGRITGLRMGYDPSASLRSAGLMLTAAMLDDSCRRGDTLVDLGVGAQAFKRRLRTAEQNIYRVSHTPPLALRCQALRAARWLRHASTPRVAS